MVPKLLIADKNKKIYDIPFLNAIGAKAGVFFTLGKDDLISLPFGSELFVLPDRYPLGYDPKVKKIIGLKYNPLKSKRQECFAVSAFISPGYTATHTAAYAENKNAKILPLFCYAPVAFYNGHFYTAAVCVDKDQRHDLRFMPITKIKKNIKKFEKPFSHNRLFTHLISCALTYNCPNAKNFFLQRCECPLPVSPLCNARCEGCISLQASDKCPLTQPRIKFVPTAREIAQIALFHIDTVKKPIVSFGQGCEGEPLIQPEVLLESIRLIRQKTKKGTINLNTNASKPDIVKALFKVGLDSMRVSINSVREKYYNIYYKPAEYSFKDVISSMKCARKLNKFVSLNYLIMPGFTDSTGELSAMLKFLQETNIDMIQWRNLNYDPAAYKRLLKLNLDAGDLVGMKEMMLVIRKKFPKIGFGYFNPPKEDWK